MCGVSITTLDAKAVLVEESVWRLAGCRGDKRTDLVKTSLL